MRWISDLSRRNSLRENDHIQSPTRKTAPLDEAPMQCSTARTINNLSMETGPLPRIKRLPDQDDDNPRTDEQTPPLNGHGSASSIERIKKIFMFFEPKGCLKERDDYSLYLFPPNNRYGTTTVQILLYNKNDDILEALDFHVVKITFLKVKSLMVLSIIFAAKQGSF